MQKSIFVVAAMIISSPLLAQDSTRVKQLNEVVVIATRTEKKVLDAPKSVTVITSRDFQQLPYQNVGDLLSRHEGIFVTGATQNPGALQYLYLRGSDARQTLIMVDGVKLSDASTVDNAIDVSELSLANIERIEIVRGSQGTLYGSSAIGGSINIITKKHTKQGVNGNASLQAGTFGSKTFATNNLVNVGYSGGSGIYIRGGYANTISDGLNATIDNGTNTSGFKGNERDGFNKHDASVKAGFEKNGWDAYAAYRRVQQKADIDDGAYRDDENYVVQYTRNVYSYGIAKTINKGLSLKFFGGYTDTERRVDDDSSFIASNPSTYDGTVLKSKYTGNYLSNEAQADINFKNLSIVAGAGVTVEKMNVNSDLFFRSFNFTSTTKYDTLGIKATTAFGYARADWKLPFAGEQYLNLGGGLRFSNHSQFGNFITFEINPSVKASANTLVYANFSKGFNAPSLYQQFAPESDFTSGISRGNNRLKAEESFTAEAGVKSIIENIISFNLSVYHNQVEHYIDYAYLWERNKPVSSLGFMDYRGDVYLNTGKMLTTGFELGIQVAPSSKFEIGANASINLGKLEYDPFAIDTVKTQGYQVQLYGNGAFLNTGGEVNVKGLVRRPSTIVNINASYKPVQSLRFMLDIRGSGQRNDIFYDPNLGPFGALGRNSIKGYTLVNLAGFYTITKNVSVNVQFNNIFNKQYNDINGFTMRGRNVWLGLNLNL
ncbi:MAG TPA: TonB-dependent receptor [Chitinophagaceae bacterium]|nr:TonB-dependent receptor [Chitinophagaceae bacterium]